LLFRLIVDHIDGSDAAHGYLRSTLGEMAQSSTLRTSKS